ncbi:hypothetical protein [Serratia fonticola]|uniref:hypothetical protein n=1 Tax=Serratia fonticola TaxID=47917 RepID=UPI0034C6C72A
MTISIERLNILQQTFKATAKASEAMEAAALNDAAAAISELLAVREAQPVAWASSVSIDRGDVREVWPNGEQDKAGNLSITPLFTAPPAPAVPAELLDAMAEVIRISDRDHDAWNRAKAAISACRAAMLNGSGVLWSGFDPARDCLPAVPDGYKLVPVELTAENGAKASLIGEFTEVKFINCPECFGDAECESCDGSGRIRVEAPVSWTTIKAIWKKGIEHFDSLAAAPTPTKAGK